MRQAIFHNFTDKPFTGYWNGKPHTVRAGEKKYMPEYLAEHFAKHLTNKILTEQGKELYCSPKKPKEVPQFYEIFSRACIIEEASDEQDEASMQIEMANRGKVSSDINLRGREQIDPYDSKSQDITGPGGKPQVIGGELDSSDEDEFESADSDKE